MTRCVLLLRGVNVGAHHRIRMPDLRVLLEGLGCTDVVTYLQSGNAVVSTDRDPGSLTTATRTALAAVGLDVPVLVRTGAELDDVVAHLPFDGEPDPALLHVGFCDGVPDPQAVAVAVDAVGPLPERLAVRGRHLYLDYTQGVQRNGLDRVVKGFGVTVTARNWRTVLALQQLLADAG